MNKTEIKRIEQFENLENEINNIYGLDKTLKNEILNNFYKNYGKVKYNDLKKLIKEDIKQKRKDNKIIKFMKKEKINNFNDAKERLLLKKNIILDKELNEINNNFKKFILKDIKLLQIKPIEIYKKIINIKYIKYENFAPLLNKILINNFNKINERITLKITTEKNNEDYEIKYYCLNDDFKKRLNDILFNRDQIINQGANFSDVEIIDKLSIAKLIEISYFIPTNKYTKKEGAFFSYFNKTIFNLERYGIYKDFKENNYNDTCLISALKFGGIEEYKLNQVISFVKNRIIPSNKLNEICELLNIIIELSYYYEETKLIKKITYKTKNKNEETKTLNIGLINDHYFINEKTDINSFVLKNYKQCKDYFDNNNSDYNKFNIIYKFRNLKPCYEERYIDSFEVVKLLLEDKETLLEKITLDNSNIINSQFYDKIDKDIINLNYDVNICSKIIKRKEEKLNDYINYYFDFETYTDNNNIHIPYICCYTDDNNNKKSFIGVDCGLQMLNSFKDKKIKLIAHNSTYDYRFLFKYLYNINELTRGTKLISCEARFNKIKIKIIDSYKLISEPLRKFPEMFKINGLIKEVMPYDLYNNVKDIYNNKYQNINYVLKKYIKKEDQEQFLNNINKWNLQEDDKYDIIEYSRQYCLIDCYILKEGYNKFKEMLKYLKISLDDHLTSASIANQYLINNECFYGCYQLSGIPQIFIQKSLVGGRCMTRKNEKQYIKADVKKNNYILDFDAVSLYPSAMYRMPGFLKGLPKVIEDLNFENIKNYDGYFLEIKIKKVGINRDFPLLSFKNDEGVRDFNNEMIDKIIFIDKIALEDAIKYQKIEFEIIRGYYFDEGFNDNINKIIENLFNERLKLKKEENPLEMIYKLIMNSAYGKTIMKPVDTENKIFDNEEDKDVFISRNYNYIKEINIIDLNKSKVKLIKSINTHFNMPHIGISVLSWSKRIMNELICLGEDNKINIFYQDTDSIHIMSNDIIKIEKLFKETYGRELIGKNLGQFHSDFSLKEATKNIKSLKLIALGKKCYINELQGEDNEGNIINGHHIRLKGIPNSTILYEAKNNYKNNPMNIYENLYKGKKIIFDLTNEGTKPNFEFNKLYEVKTKLNFKREIKF